MAYIMINILKEPHCTLKIFPKEAITKQFMLYILSTCKIRELKNRERKKNYKKEVKF